MAVLAVETLLLTEKATVSFERSEGGKIRVGVTGWDDFRVIYPDEVLRFAASGIRCVLPAKTGFPTKGPCDQAV
jgi:hypothetical protein